MENTFRLVSRAHEKETLYDLRNFSTTQAAAVREYHRTFPMYRPTPLVHLADTAQHLGIDAIYIKDESHRFGLNAFKVLGGSYAIGCCLAEKLGIPMSQLSYDLLTKPETKEKLGDLTFVTATDGNHGRGVAWTAAQLGMQSVVYMPKGTAAERLENIRALGSNASIIDGNYDDCVRLANSQAQQKGWILVQDTSWEGYEEIPTRIMQGYGTMALEALEQLPQAPTHIFLQAGVGSMAAAVAGLFASHYGKDRPIIAVVEPTKADCFYRTAKANDGKLHAVSGDMDTIMAGLACGEPCTLAWDILADYGDHFIACPDYAAAKGMRILSSPQGADSPVVSGESGASAFGCVAEILTKPQLSSLRDKLCLDRHSRILFFSTEGATDRENYKAIVWDGKYPSI